MRQSTHVGLEDIEVQAILGLITDLVEAVVELPDLLRTRWAIIGSVPLPDAQVPALTGRLGRL